MSNLEGSSEVVFKTPWFRVESELFPQYLGYKPFFRLVVPNGVSILPVTKDGEVVCIRQFRPAINQFTLELPAGEIDPGEDAVDAGARELYEETGFLCKKFTVIGDQLAVIGNRSTQLQTIIFGHEAKLDHNFIPKEAIEISLHAVYELEEKIFNGTFKEALGVTAFGLARLRGLV